MRIFRKLDALPTFKNSILTIGTYDGVHFGHQQIVHRINELAAEHQGESILITFHPHPRTIVNTSQAVQLLSPLEEKLSLLKKYGVDNVVVVPFTRAFSAQSPEAYIRDFLVQKFSPKIIVIGYDHRFGNKRKGDIGLLEKMSSEFKYEVEQISPQAIDDLAVSSTKIRNALAAGDVKKAANYLGHPYEIRGVVTRGKQLGRRIGFPTANVQSEDQDKLIPKNGVYAVKVKVRETEHMGMLNIGIRPTVDDSRLVSIEVNIFDFDLNVYGDKISIQLIDQLREEKKFGDLQELIAQLQRDEQLSRKILSKA